MSASPAPDGSSLASSHGDGQLRGLTLSELISNVPTSPGPPYLRRSRVHGGDSLLDVAGGSGLVSDVYTHTADAEPEEGPIDWDVAPRCNTESPPPPPNPKAIAFCSRVAVSELSITRERHQASLALLTSLEEAQARGSELGSLEALLKVSTHPKPAL